jgi:hypothetical protein
LPGQANRKESEVWIVVFGLLHGRDANWGGIEKDNATVKLFGQGMFKTDVFADATAVNHAIRPQFMRANSIGAARF